MMNMEVWRRLLKQQRLGSSIDDTLTLIISQMPMSGSIQIRVVKIFQINNNCLKEAPIEELSKLIYATLGDIVFESHYGGY